MSAGADEEARNSFLSVACGGDDRSCGDRDGRDSTNSNPGQPERHLKLPMGHSREAS